MIKIENTVLPSPKQWEAIIKLAKQLTKDETESDSYSTYLADEKHDVTADFAYFVGPNDLEVLKKAIDKGILDVIPVFVDKSVDEKRTLLAGRYSDIKEVYESIKEIEEKVEEGNIAAAFELDANTEIFKTFKEWVETLPYSGLITGEWEE